MSAYPKRSGPPCGKGTVHTGLLGARLSAWSPLRQHAGEAMPSDRVALGNSPCNRNNVVQVRPDPLHAVQLPLRVSPYLIPLFALATQGPTSCESRSRPLLPDRNDAGLLRRLGDRIEPGSAPCCL